MHVIMGKVDKSLKVLPCLMAYAVAEPPAGNGTGLWCPAPAKILQKRSHLCLKEKSNTYLWF